MDEVYIGIVVYGGGDIVLWCKKVKPVDAVCSGHSRIVIYGGEDIVFGAKRSNQWMQYAVDAVELWYMVAGTLSLMQKGQTSGFSGCSQFKLLKQLFESLIIVITLQFRILPHRRNAILGIEINNTNSLHGWKP